MHFSPINYFYLGKLQQAPLKSCEMTFPKTFQKMYSPPLKVFINATEKSMPTLSVTSLTEYSIFRKDSYSFKQTPIRQIIRGSVISQNTLRESHFVKLQQRLV